MNVRNIDRYISILNVFSTTYIDRRLKQYDINKTKAVVMLYISKYNLSTQNDINYYFSMQKSAMTKVINALVKVDYVKRIECEKDKRARLLTLTDAGWDMIPIINEVLDEWANHSLNNLSGEELEQLESILSKLVTRVSEKDI